MGLAVAFIELPAVRAGGTNDFWGRPAWIEIMRHRRVGIQGHRVAAGYPMDRSTQRRLA